MPFKTYSLHCIEFTSANIYGAVTLYRRPRFLPEKKERYTLGPKGDQRVLERGLIVHSHWWTFGCGKCCNRAMNIKCLFHLLLLQCNGLFAYLPPTSPQGLFITLILVLNILPCVQEMFKIFNWWVNKWSTETSYKIK